MTTNSKTNNNSIFECFSLLLLFLARFVLICFIRKWPIANQIISTHLSSSFFSFFPFLSLALSLFIIVRLLSLFSLALPYLIQAAFDGIYYKLSELYFEETNMVSETVCLFSLISLSLSLNLHIYVFIYIYVCICAQTWANVSGNLSRCKSSPLQKQHVHIVIYKYRMRYSFV